MKQSTSAATFSRLLFLVLILRGSSATAEKASSAPISSDWAGPAGSSRKGGQTRFFDASRQLETSWGGNNLMQQGMGMTTRPTTHSVWGRNWLSLSCVFLLFFLSLAGVANAEPHADPDSPPPPHDPDADMEDATKKTMWDSLLGFQRSMSVSRKRPEDVLKEDELPDELPALSPILATIARPTAKNADKQAQETLMQSEAESLAGSTLGFQRGMYLRKALVPEKQEQSVVEAKTETPQTPLLPKEASTMLGLQRGMKLTKKAPPSESQVELPSAPKTKNLAAASLTQGSTLGLQRGSVTKKVVVMEEEDDDAPGSQVEKADAITKAQTASSPVGGSALGLQRSATLTQRKAPVVEQAVEEVATLPKAQGLLAGSVLGLQRGMKLEKVPAQQFEEDEEAETSTASPPSSILSEAASSEDLSLQRETSTDKAVLAAENDDIAAQLAADMEDEDFLAASVMGLQRSAKLIRSQTTATQPPALVYE